MRSACGQEGSELRRTRKMPRKNPRSGSTLDKLLKADGFYGDCKTHAIKKALAYKLDEAMKAQKLSKTSMTKKMETSRSQLDRLLDPENESVTLHTMEKPAAFLV